MDAQHAARAVRRDESLLTASTPPGEIYLQTKGSAALAAHI